MKIILRVFCGLAEPMNRIELLSTLYESAVLPLNYIGGSYGAPDANYFEPILNYIILELNKVMKFYQAFEK